MIAPTLDRNSSHSGIPSTMNRARVVRASRKVSRSSAPARSTSKPFSLNESRKARQCGPVPMTTMGSFAISPAPR